MSDSIKFHYKKSRAQRSIKFFSMATMSVIYIVGMKVYEHWNNTLVSEPTRSIVFWVFSVSALLLVLIGIWHLRNPATFEAIVTTHRMKITYPGSKQWSFDIALSDIKRFEYRKTVSHAGDGILNHGVLLKDGTFQHISMNYDLNIKTLFEAVQGQRPNISFPNTVNKKVEGFLAKDYKE